VDNAAAGPGRPASFVIMLLEPSDQFGLVIPQARPTTAWSAVAALASAGRGLHDAADRLAAAPSGAHAWQGGAADGYRRQRAELSRRLVEAAEVAMEASALIGAWYDEAGAAVSAMRLGRSRVEEARAAVKAAQEQRHEYANPELTRAEQDAWDAWARAKRSYWDGLARLAGRLLALRDRITSRPWDGTDQAEGFFRGLAQGLVTEPLGFAWGLTGEAAVDRDAWWANVSGLPAAVWSSATQLVTSPVATAGEYVDADGWQHGRYGEAAAAAAGILLPGPHWLKQGDHLVGARKYAHTLLDPSLPKPKLQTVDEMLEGVDLTRHEHAEYGHTLSRHVDVDDEYLMDRVTHGTLVGGQERGFIPKEASRFADRPTAEKAVTEALRADENTLRSFAASGKASGTIRFTAGQDLGRVIARVDGGFDARDGATVVVQLGNGPEGPYIRSAYVE
jgi:hypothetical protein